MVIFNLKFFLLSLAVLIFASGCAEKEAANKRKSPEVLIAKDCGFDKLKCCADEPACTYGQMCCQNPNSNSENYCADDCSCGEAEEFCCAGNKCQGDLDCVNGICLPCGGEKEICCSAGVQCDSGLACQGGECVKCGVDSGPCCLSGDKCLAEAGRRSQCLNEICHNCGFDGHPACLTGERCLPGQLDVGAACERCGGANQPCCKKDSVFGSECDLERGLECRLGFCAPKS